MITNIENKLRNIIQEREEKIKPENIKEGVTILGVEGSYRSNIKLFDTIENMQADSSSKLNDLAVVYRDKTHNIENESIFSSCIFPKIVTLPETITTITYRTNFNAIDMSTSYFSRKC